MTYDPATPLRADATDEQITSRFVQVIAENEDSASPNRTPFLRSVAVARELQAATVAEYEAKLAALDRDREEWLHDAETEAMALERLANAEPWSQMTNPRLQVAVMSSAIVQYIRQARTPSPEGGT